ncbi:hypothetical protein FVA81_03400 (plasmid) [Rhizobium sp. WL3]|uniref:hypothetical protein n=1 Tax=Rhizobium sp. WL3 TaxID=2603277 RepID=UPI0011C1D95F|nr:hypothetical protein [Rhizobium sp. WL3]QEE43681.1 hypothetical protein FVA81_03400 [Rhizobium sp. WL3]
MKKKILVVLPSPLMARNFLRSDALQLLTECGDNEVLVVSPNPDDRAVAEKAGAEWLPYYHPRRTRTGKGVVADLVRWARYARYLCGLAIHMSLTHRFNRISAFRGFAGRLKQSWSLRRIYLREGLPMSSLFGIPLARSEFLYKLLRRIYYSRWQNFGPVDRLLEGFRPNLVILSMIQTHMVTPYALAAHRMNVPLLGMSGSWDQPTTKGPVVPMLSRVVVQNAIVREELVRYHGIPEERVHLIGWLQMDAYARTRENESASQLRRFNLRPGTRYILFAANAPRLGSHEPGIVRELAAANEAGAFGNGVVVLCRCHPQDTAWQSRWGWASELPGVVVQPPDLGPLEHLTAVISQASVVLASAGSINLDAIALDVPTIGIAWEDETLPYYDRPARAYDLEHLADLLSSEGMAFARDMPSLINACQRYLADKTLDALGRATLRQRYLYRLDGGAARRLHDNVKEMLS